jgi:hypothetical protein
VVAVDGEIGNGGVKAAAIAEVFGGLLVRGGRRGEATIANVVLPVVEAFFEVAAAAQAATWYYGQRNINIVPFLIFYFLCRFLRSHFCAGTFQLF